MTFHSRFIPNIVWDQGRLLATARDNTHTCCSFAHFSMPYLFLLVLSFQRVSSPTVGLSWFGFNCPVGTLHNCLHLEPIVPSVAPLDTWAAPPEHLAQRAHLFGADVAGWPFVKVSHPLRTLIVASLPHHPFGSTTLWMPRRWRFTLSGGICSKALPETWTTS